MVLRATGSSGGGGGGSGIVVGTTTVTGGTPGDVLYDNSGVVGELAIPTFTALNLGAPVYVSNATGNGAVSSPAAFAGFALYSTSGAPTAVVPAAGVATFLATPSSANLATAMTDETGTGPLMFGTTPVITGTTWASLPTASSHAGAVARVTDIGQATGGSLWISNGTVWKPVNGILPLISNIARTSAAGAASETLTNLKFQAPAAFFSVGDKLRLYMTMSKAGATTVGSVGIRMGTAGTTADTSVSAWQIFNASSRSSASIIDFTIASATTIQVEGAVGTAAAGGYGAVSTNQYLGAVTISNISNSLFFEVTITPGLTDAVALEQGQLLYLPAN